MSLDIEKIRGDFPFLDEEKVGRKIIYLDSAATSQKPRQVIKAMDDYYSYGNANPHRGGHYLGRKATEAYESVREKVAKYIGAERPEEVIFTRSTTESLNLIAYSYALNNLKEGDEILITILEHHANLVTRQMVAKKTGAKLVYAYLDEGNCLDYEDLKAKINERTKIVAFTGAGNVTGEIIDAKKIISRAHQVGAIAVLDGAQLLPHTRVDVKDLDCDFLAFSGHKMFAEMGVGVLYGKYDLLDKMEPFNLGGDMIEYVHQQETTFAKPASRFEAGTQNVGAVVSLGAAIDYLEELGPENIFSYERDLTKYAYDQIKDLDHIRTFYPENGKASSVLAFVFDDLHPEDLATIIDSPSLTPEGVSVAIRTGHHCAMPLHEYFGIVSSARASFSIYNTEEEVDEFVKRLLEARKVMGL